MKIKAKYKKKPVYATELAAGMDLEANIEKPIILKPLQRTLVPTGLHLELPVGYEAQVRGRSGLAIREGLVVALGTIDADYRGEINAIVFNLSDKDIIIKPNQRICQLIICKYEKIELTLGELSDTKRGSNGFGSTGV
jgi:dUTP pyrophosphatase